MTVRKPTAEQAAAIATAAPEVLLRAGAGSGKTTVLVERYCDLVDRGGVGPDQILAFTFTKKAAAQLRERIRRELVARAGRCEDPERASRLADAAARVGSAWVMTIHGFCQAVIGAHPVAAGIDPAFTVIEGVAREKLRRRAFDRALERLLADPEEAAVRERTVAVYGIDRLREIVIAAYDDLRSHGMSEPRLPEPPRNDPEELLARLEEAATRLLNDPDYRPQKRNHDKIAALATIAAKRREWLAGEPPAAGPAALLAELEPHCFESKVDGRLEVGALAAAVCRALYETGEGGACYGHLALLVELYGAEFAAAKAERSGLDFDDLQDLAVRLLRDTPAIGDLYRDRFRHLLVDEFQDTSPVQIELIEALSGPETSVFRVGDKFQAIYAFRHADLANFDRVNARLRATEDAEVLPLSGNFRSRAAVLAVANGLAADLMPGFPPLTVGSADQGRAPRGGGSGVELILTAPAGWDEAEPAPPTPEAVTPKRGAEIEAVAHRLAELVAAGVPRGDIVVLLRTLGPAGAYAAAMERRGLRPFVVDGRGFWQGREVIDAVALLRAIANPLDEEGLFGALASPACAAAPDALWMLRRAAGRRPVWWAVEALAAGDEGRGEGLEAPEWLARIAPDDAAAIRSLHANLNRLRAQRATTELSALVDRAFRLTGLDLAVAGGARGPAGLAALRKLSRLAGEYEAAEGRDLRGFLDYAQLQAAQGREAEAPIAAEGHDGVRIMTMHAAKGLEFPVVAVPELGRRFGGGGGNQPALRLARSDGGDWLVGLRLARLNDGGVKLFDWEEIDELEKQEQAEEELRLFYVAMTRAQERLILSGQASPLPKDGISPTTPVLTRILDLFGVTVDKDGPPPRFDSPVFEPPEPRPGLEARFEPARLEVRFNWPEPEHRLILRSPLDPDAVPGPAAAAAAEATAMDPATATAPPTEATATDPATSGVPTGEDAGPGRARPPIAALPEPPPPLPSLSFTALASLSSAASAAAAGDEEPAARRGEADEIGLDAAGRAFGNAVHGLLERALQPAPGGARRRPITEAMIARALAAEGLAGADAVARARGQIEGWLASDLCAEISRPGVRLRAETPLLWRPRALGDATLRGWIDLLAEPADGPPLVIDYKTNRLDGRSPERVAADYRLQGWIYALAVSRALDAAEVEVAFVLLEAPDQPVRSRFGPAELEAAEREIIGRIESLRGVGRAFEAGGELVEA